jgi:hypothetical protein
MRKRSTIKRISIVTGCVVIFLAAAYALFDKFLQPKQKMVGGRIVSIACEKYEGQPSGFNCTTGGAIGAKGKKYQLLCNDGTSAEVLQEFCQLQIDFEHKHEAK